MTGDVWLSRNMKPGERIFGWAIRWTPPWAKRKRRLEPWNHAMIELASGELVSAEGKGVRLRSPGHYIGRYKAHAVYRPILTDSQRHDVAAHAAAFVGVKYSWRGIAGQAVRKLSGFSGWGAKVAGWIGGSDDAVYCSEMVATSFYRATKFRFCGWARHAKLHPGAVAPRDVAHTAIIEGWRLVERYERNRRVI